MTAARAAAATLAVALGLGFAGLEPSLALASPPAPAPAEPTSTTMLRGRVRERGPSRAPVAAAVVIVVNAPPDVRPGQPAADPLDPDTVTWMHRTQTDSEGRFQLPAVPVGTLRVVVVAGGYVRLEQWAAAGLDGRELELRLEPEQGGAYRTEVTTRRSRSAFAVPPLNTLDGQAARRYPGSGDDPLLAALNLPGVARSPGGLGLLSFRGADPNDVGVYVDGHPVPRAFHVIPIASVLSPPMTDRITLDPGNYAANYGGFGGGLVTIDSRAGRRDGIHGQTHFDLFDAGGTIEGALGKGSVHAGVRRSHAGDILRLVNLPQLSAPNFWDYLVRVDQPVARGHSIGVRSLGAGDRLLLGDYFDFRASFHRFDLDYRFDSPRWQILLSPSLRLDASQRAGPSDSNEIGDRRDAQVYSVRAAFRWQAFNWLALDFGADVVAERWRRRAREPVFHHTQWGSFPVTHELVSAEGEQLRFGAWLAAPLKLGDWSLIPSVRVNVFSYGPDPSLRIDPRVNLRGPIAGPVQLLAAAGMFGIPVIGARRAATEGFVNPRGEIVGGVADVPEYLIAYFDPNIEGEVVGRSATATHIIHASLGFEAALPWDLELRALGFWREGLATTFERPYDPSMPTSQPTEGEYGQRRSMGLELLLRRSPVAGVLDGWIGYTLLWARVQERTVDWLPPVWLPAVFDQRHNFVALLSAALPRGVRVGLRFRLSSGNPETPITGREIIQDYGDIAAPGYEGIFAYRPLRGPRGTSYQPLFHQLDLRIDKTWVLKQVSVGVYLDVQNVYNRVYPEVWIYSTDWSYRQGSIGVPIYPSVGVQVNY